MKFTAEQVRLVSIEAEKIANVDFGEKVVTLAVFRDKGDSFGEVEKKILSAQFKYGKNEWSDAELIRIARADFHELCKGLVEATREWEMDDNARKACEHPLKQKPVELPF